MAINFKSIVDNYYGGNAELLAQPVPPVPAFMNAYTPLEKLPDSTREMYEYHPDKAKQLLAEAGYTSGFKTNVITANTAQWIDLLSIIKNYWQKVGVDLEIQQREASVWKSIQTAGKHHCGKQVTGIRLSAKFA